VTFDGWYDGETAVDADYVYAADTVLSAKWAAEGLMIMKQPENTDAAVGGQISYTVKALNADTYQWYYSKDGGNKWYKSTAAGAATETLSMTVKSNNKDNRYKCRLTGAGGTVLESEIVYNEIADNALKVTDITVSDNTSDDTESITVTAENAASYQWYYSKDGAKWYKSTLENVTADDNSSNTASVAVKSSNISNLYKCRVTGIDGTSAYSEPVSLIGAPVIETDPVDVTASAGDTVEFTVTVKDPESYDYTYQWYYSKDGGNKWYKSFATGADSATMSMKAKASNNGMMYRCKVSGKAGVSVNSDEAVLTVS
jgi:hypothetical protein